MENEPATLSFARQSIFTSRTTVGGVATHTSALSVNPKAVRPEKVCEIAILIARCLELQIGTSRLISLTMSEQSKTSNKLLRHIQQEPLLLENCRGGWDLEALKFTGGIAVRDIVQVHRDDYGDLLEEQPRHMEWSVLTGEMETGSEIALDGSWSLSGGRMMYFPVGEKLGISTLITDDPTGHDPNGRSAAAA